MKNWKENGKKEGLKEEARRGTWVAQSVKHPTLGFSSGHDLTVSGLEPHAGLCAASAELARDSLSPSFSAPPPLALSLFL